MTEPTDSGDPISDGSGLDLEYPCPWEYRVIGADEARLRKAVDQVLGDRPHEVAAGRSSAGGKWVTLVVTLEVANEAERVGLYEELRDHDAVKLVL